MYKIYKDDNIVGNLADNGLVTASDPSFTLVVARMYDEGMAVLVGGGEQDGVYYDFGAIVKPSEDPTITAMWLDSNGYHTEWEEPV